MAEIKNRAIINVIFYYGLRDTPLECLSKKYVVTNWDDKSDLLRLLDQIAKELNYISGYGISLIKVKSDRFDFEHKVALQPYHSEVDNSATLNHFVFQKVLKFEVGRCKGRGGTVRLEVPRLWEGVANSWDLLEFNDRLLLIRVVPNSKAAKQKGIDYLTYFDQEDLVLLSFLKRISNDGGLEPFTKKVWEGNPLLVPSYGDIKLYNLPVTQTSYYKKKKGWAQEKKRLKAEENKRLKHERSGVIYKDQKNTKKADQVYLIKMSSVRVDEDVYKIGISNAPGKRLKALSTASPFELEMIHRFIAEPAKEAERRLHMLYENTRLNGEWFKLTPSQIKDLKEITRFKDGVFLKETDS